MLNPELNNDIVTVTQLQIALSAGGSSIQSQLSNLSLKADTKTPTGLYELLEVTLEQFLENALYWTHLLGSSETFESREAAEAVFERLSLQERGKFSAETLSNVEGIITQADQPAVIQDRGEAAYVVITLLLGTAHDSPLFSQIDTISAMKTALSQLRSLSSDYLLVFELLWSPQAQTDTLSVQDMATYYGNMKAIA
ncbi:DUF1517 domain-containing protein [Phormidium pseudopriestleyi FRX01]|uniref:DUF1517 domain-containing protein n=1 Tax=Phormidium pseudopriestleyi FRX01 TaxID=1759528 RepID=A0ABS3FUB0_9CYAN|nr:DUF1517 domain-containing protein [Phormidium pseudopriestleyi]MBO0350719.1 DUF1517 domain-containing protein [Phormidium pseudopriestleyi FRX01]